MLNKTPVAKNAKTGSALRNKLAVVGLGLFVCALFILLVLTSLVRDKNNQPDVASVSKPDSYCLKTMADNYSDCSIRLELAGTDAQRTKGLSGRDSLAVDHGMLFRFDQAGTHCMWMKDMKLPIDILWLDDSDKIVKIEHNLSPDTYPASFCADNSKQVVELSSGSALRLGLHPGDKTVVD